MEEDDATLGFDVIRTGKLKELRIQFGLSSLAMSDFMGVMVTTYRTWEKLPDINIRKGNAARIGRFYRACQRQAEVLSEAGVTVSELVPLHTVATMKGLTQEGLLHRYRDGEFSAVDLGVLGLWMTRQEVEKV